MPGFLCGCRVPPPLLPQIGILYCILLVNGVAFENYHPFHQVRFTTDDVRALIMCVTNENCFLRTGWTTPQNVLFDKILKIVSAYRLAWLTHQGVGNCEKHNVRIVHEHVFTFSKKIFLLNLGP